MDKTPATIYAAIREQLVKPGGLALAFLSMALGLVAFYVLPDWKVTAQALTVTTILGVAYIWISATALREGLSRERDLHSRLSDALAGNRYAPKVVQAMPSPADEATLLLLLEPNRLFGQSMLVSLYYEDERGFELLVGSGQVANVQTNGMIQIDVTAWDEAHGEIRRGVVAQDVTKIARLLIRPAPTTQSAVDPTAGQWALLASLQTLIESQRNDRQF